MKFWFALCIACSVLFFNGCSSEKKKADDNSSNAKEEAKSEKIVLQDVSGKEIVVTTRDKGFSFAGFENKVVLVNFFTTWCPPCKAEIPHLNNLQEKYKDNFVIISVLLEENKSNEEVNSFIKYNNINYIITNSIENFKLAQSAGGVKNIPLMFLYDKEGKYSTHYVGAIPEEMIDADIKKVL
ncbi:MULTISPECIES: TlpA disulfide reductase family protein [unclassified Sulfurospirillum]|uniref:TlpA family protein disulfide reductase n=1 Tax=unclassified Sulfurospirillum TaxID=2618290 RepID=UPI000501761B|nr:MULTISPECIES: TlpA disulfide reductase family protein [unclassified Sulfurospirillum]KFL34506.1 redoxin [Sulfurospirillum sp. SCADC]